MVMIMNGELDGNSTQLGYAARIYMDLPFAQKKMTKTVEFPVRNHSSHILDMLWCFIHEGFAK